MLRSLQSFLTSEWTERLEVDRASSVLPYSHSNTNIAALADIEVWTTAIGIGVQAKPPFVAHQARLHLAGLRPLRKKKEGCDNNR
jgi:hypothetical protein